MSARSKKSIHYPASSSGTPCTSSDSGSDYIPDEPAVEVSAVRARRSRPPKRRENLKEETSTDSGGDYVPNEPPVEVSAVRARRGRPSKRKDNVKEEIKTILAWVIDCNIVQEYAAVCCVDTYQQCLKDGRITRAGVLCDCCSQVFSAEKFQYHAVGEVDKPYGHINIIGMNNSLMDCMVRAWDLPSEMARREDNLIQGSGEYDGEYDKYDDVCMICGDGGELMCCDRENCHSTHHPRCLGMEDVPESAWFCPYCVCKWCRNPGCEEGFMLTCLQCGKKYHWECELDRGPNPIHIDINSTPISSTPISPYCEQGCEQIYDKLGKMVGVSNKLDDSYTWTLLRRTYKGESAAGLRDSYIETECHSKLAIACSLMKDCFKLISDRHTDVDVIESILYSCGSNYTRINFKGFYTAVLEKDGEIISAASLRIHGEKLAEMPFIATNAIHRRKGMCRKLMAAIESALHFLNVEYLIIPSVSRKAKTWTEGFNFSHLTNEMKEEIMFYNTVMFHDSIRLQKAMTPPDNGQAVARKAEINAEKTPKRFGNRLEPGSDRK